LRRQSVDESNLPTAIDNSPMPAQSSNPSSWPPILGYGFRPFFLLASIHAAIAVPVWLAALLGHGYYRPPLPPLAWHAHEMLFGFILAAVAGFLLTAVPSWTGQRGYAGAPLLALTVLWIAGRLVTSLPLGLPALLVALIDLAFIPALVLTLLPALIRSGNLRNTVFIGMLAALFAANLHFHLAGASSVDPLMLGINLILLMVAMVGGRILPAFTSSGLKQQGIDVRIRRYPPLDIATLMAAFAILIIDIFFQGTTIAAVAALLAAALLALRMARWQGHRTLHQPIIWVLHIAYAWLPIGLALKAVWLFGAPIPETSWLHALTTGAFSTMILAVMSRVALGHTGRELVAPGLIVVAYYLITIAALVRVFGPILHTEGWRLWMIASGLIWSLAFILFVVVYAPILCSRRADGRAG
jgi:uncharacterized protein involved in response to NO